MKEGASLILQRIGGLILSGFGSKNLLTDTILSCDLLQLSLFPNPSFVQTHFAFLLPGTEVFEVLLSGYDSQWPTAILL